MRVHLIKLCVGASSVADLAGWIEKRATANRKSGAGAVTEHLTRMQPRRRVELLAGGSLYWVIKGVVLARQRIIGLEPRAGADGVRRCAIVLDPALVPTEPQPRRAFQGWRYLRAEDAPRDLSGTTRASPELGAELAALGLL